MIPWVVYLCWGNDLAEGVCCGEGCSYHVKKIHVGSECAKIGCYDKAFFSPKITVIKTLTLYREFIYIFIFYF